jgi:hypothetical protein
VLKAAPLILFSLLPIAFLKAEGISLREAAEVHTERAEDPGVLVWRTEESPRLVSQHDRFISYQVNVGFNGANIVGDAANEPSITIDPADRRRMAIGWRQFDTVQSNFRKGGWGYTTDGGLNWTFPGALDGSFRSDPVLMPDATGSFFYLSLVPNFFCDIWRSSTYGQSWAYVAPARGGDKQWFVIDTTNSPGRGFQYQAWSTAGNNYQGRQFTRSTDGGLTWLDPIFIPDGPSWGTLDVDSSGNLYIAGFNLDTGILWCVRSTDAKNPAVVPTFDQSTQVNLGGAPVVGMPINPVGLIGQVTVAADRSGTATNKQRLYPGERAAAEPSGRRGWNRRDVHEKH